MANRFIKKLYNLISSINTTGLCFSITVLVEETKSLGGNKFVCTPPQRKKIGKKSE